MDGLENVESVNLIKFFETKENRTLDRAKAALESALGTLAGESQIFENLRAETILVDPRANVSLAKEAHEQSKNHPKAYNSGQTFAENDAWLQNQHALAKAFYHALASGAGNPDRFDVETGIDNHVSELSGDFTRALDKMTAKEEHKRFKTPRDAINFVKGINKSNFSRWIAGIVILVLLGLGVFVAYSSRTVAGSGTPKTTVGPTGGTGDKGAGSSTGNVVEQPTGNSGPTGQQAPSGATSTQTIPPAPAPGGSTGVTGPSADPAPPPKTTRKKEGGKGKSTTTPALPKTPVVVPRPAPSPRTNSQMVPLPFSFGGPVSAETLDGIRAAAAALQGPGAAIFLDKLGSRPAYTIGESLAVEFSCQSKCTAVLLHRGAGGHYQVIWSDVLGANAITHFGPIRITPPAGNEEFILIATHATLQLGQLGAAPSALSRIVSAAIAKFEVRP